MTTVRSLLLHLLGFDKAKHKICNKDDEDTFGNSKCFTRLCLVSFFFSFLCFLVIASSILEFRLKE